MSLGPMEIAIIALVIFALFGYKKLPDASRAIGRSLRIFKGEMKGMKEDDIATKAEAQTARPTITPQSAAHTPQSGAHAADIPTTTYVPPRPAEPAAAPMPQTSAQSMPGPAARMDDPTAPPSNPLR